MVRSSLQDWNSKFQIPLSIHVGCWIRIYSHSVWTSNIFCTQMLASGCCLAETTGIFSNHIFICTFKMHVICINTVYVYYMHHMFLYITVWKYFHVFITHYFFKILFLSEKVGIYVHRVYDPSHQDCWNRNGFWGHLSNWWLHILTFISYSGPPLPSRVTALFLKDPLWIWLLGSLLLFVSFFVFHLFYW